MVVLLILVLSCLIFRGLGSAGIPAFANWQTSARDALSLMLVFTGISHFTFMKEDFVRMIPPSIPWPRALVYFMFAPSSPAGSRRGHSCDSQHFRESSSLGNPF